MSGLTIQFASDLHLEFPENRAYMDRYPLSKAGDILLLAGDIFYLSSTLKNDPSLLERFPDFDRVLIIPGNHEFYKQSKDISEVLPDCELQLNDQVTYFENKIILLDNDVRLIGTTLWTRIKNKEIVETQMNDFRQSLFDGQTFTAEDFNNCHDRCKGFLEKALAEPFDGKTIVMTHHVPFPAELIRPGFKGDVQEAYHVDMSDLLKNYRVDHWIHGHNHANKPSFELEGIQIHTNQLGYTFYGDTSSFRNDATITL